MRDTFWHQGWITPPLYCLQCINFRLPKEDKMPVKRHVVTIVIEDIALAFQPVSDLLHSHASYILLRVGYPMRDWGASVIFLVMEMTTPEMGAFSGKLGMVPGLNVKTQTLRIEQGDNNEV